MRTNCFFIICFVSILIINATTIDNKLFHKDSYGEVFYGNSTSLSKTFDNVNIINWSARSFIDGRSIVVSFTLSGAETVVENFSLLNQYSIKSGSVGDASRTSTYNLNGNVTSNGSFNEASGMISFDAFATELN